MLTDTQAGVLAFIQRFRSEYQMPPTREEIRHHFGWNSPNSAQAVLIALEKKGRIKIMLGKARGIYVLDSSGA